MDYYSILNVDSNSTQDEIKKSFRNLSFKYHPDKNNGQDSQFKMINEAYEILGDKLKRQEYDMMSNTSELSQRKRGNIFESMINNFLNPHVQQNKHKHKQDNMVNEDFIQDIFENMMKMSSKNISENIRSDPNVFFFTNDQKIQENIVDDIYADAFITFSQSYHGCTIPIIIERENFNGNNKLVEKEKVYLTLPPGVDNEEIITIKNKGNVNIDKIGDVKVKVTVENDDYTYLFERNGVDLLHHKEISFKDSICGFEFELEHINGKVLKFDSSRGNIIQNYDRKVIKEKGFQRNNIIGDLIIIFHVSHPVEKLNEVQLKLFDTVL